MQKGVSPKAPPGSLSPQLVEKGVSRKLLTIYYILSLLNFYNYERKVIPTVYYVDVISMSLKTVLVTFTFTWVWAQPLGPGVDITIILTVQNTNNKLIINK